MTTIPKEKSSSMRAIDREIEDILYKLEGSVHNFPRNDEKLAKIKSLVLGIITESWKGKMYTEKVGNLLYNLTQLIPDFIPDPNDGYQKDLKKLVKDVENSLIMRSIIMECEKENEENEEKDDGEDNKEENSQ